MLFFRVLMAIVCYLIGLGFVLALIVLPFQVVYVMGCFLGFLMAYVWYPSRRQDRIKRHTAEEFAGELVLQVIIELPIRILLWLLKLPFRALQHGDVSF